MSIKVDKVEFKGRARKKIVSNNPKLVFACGVLA